MKTGVAYLFTLASLFVTSAPAVAQGSDDCGTASPVVGTGTFPFDNSSATTDGPSHPSCDPPQIVRDVWFAWTAPANGMVTIQTCGLTAVDTMLAVYAGSGCPLGDPLACNDDDCAVQSRLSVTVVGGLSYLIRVGSWTDDPGGTGAFEIDYVVPALGDDCATPIPIFGEGTFHFDNSGATTDGAPDVLCVPPGGQIESDVWFAWTSTWDGQATFETCRLTSIDTELAVYAGMGCPTEPALACNDDFCDIQSSLSISVSSGSMYTIRVGSWPSSPPGPGELLVREGGMPWDCAAPVAGPDVIVGAIVAIMRWGTVGGVTGYSISGSACNVGDSTMAWEGPSNQHPVIAQHLYRLDGVSIEQIGMSWIKHGFGSATENACCQCQDPGDPQIMGVGCADTYSAATNGNQAGSGVGGLGPRSDVNPTTGVFPFPYSTQGMAGDAIYKRMQVANDDLEPALNPGAAYVAEVHYLAPEDAAAGNGINNASYRPVNVGALISGGYELNLAGQVEATSPAILAWAEADPLVEIDTVELPGDGLFYLASRCTDNGDGTWHYEYAAYNHNSDRAARALAVPLPPGVTPTNVGFKDVEYHSGEIYDGTDWNAQVQPTRLRWFTGAFAHMGLANALRWGSLYNFRFDAPTPPVPSAVSLELFKPGIPSAVTLSACAPGPPCQAEPFCTTAPNSAGPGARLEGGGTTSAAANDFTLEVSLAPANRPGLFYFGPTPIQAPFGDGFRCVGGATNRLYPIRFTTGAGELSRPVDLTSPPASDRIRPGQTWYFQFWFRDGTGPGGSGFNLTDGLAASFCP